VTPHLELKNRDGGPSLVAHGCPLIGAGERPSS
jgi:hypothetical protein